MRKKCLAWKSGLAGAIAREKIGSYLAILAYFLQTLYQIYAKMTPPRRILTIFWLGKTRGLFVSEFVTFWARLSLLVVILSN